MTGLAGTSPNASGPERRQSLVTVREITLARELSKLDETLPRMYRGALVVLRDNSNPDRLALSAHGFRELMEKLARIMNTSVKTDNTTLKSKVNDLDNEYKRALKNSKSISHPVSAKVEIDAAHKRFINKLSKFFEWFKHRQPKRRDEARLALRQLEGSGRVEVEVMAEINARSWLKLNEFFQLVSHHRHLAEETEFLNRTAELEGMLLDRLQPNTYKDFAELDTLISEGISNA